ncbi:MAG TPA: aminopeptidase P N-terminal domain-containing protein [Bacteroidales bacterium]|nr:aminopeptidase P N-terminal domain-containing protein [Bacteroidales bacterium]
MKTITMPPAFFTVNRERLSHALKPRSLAIFHANDEMNRTADQDFPYRQDSDLFYLTGINQEKTALLIAPDYPDESMREILIIRRANPKLETWEGHKYTVEEARAISGIKTVYYADEYDSVLAPMMMFNYNIYLNLPELHKIIPELPNRNLRFSYDIQRRFPAHHYERLAPIMRDLRTMKSEAEITMIKEACAITRDAFQRVLKTVKPGMTEYEVEAEITYEFVRKGGRHAYQPIIGSGINGCSLHYLYNNSTCNDGDLLLMDFGAEYANYAADCTRTIPVNGKFTARQKDLYKSVLDVFRYACSLMRPGNTINNMHADVCRRFSLEHVRVGLYTAEELKNEPREKPLYQKYYMHGTSHFLGLDVHDVGGKDAEFRPGMILTCEPGIYLPEEKTGIRIESNILITRDGNLDLMKDIPVEPDEIEKLMASR